MSTLNKIPFLGSGISVRPQILGNIMAHHKEIDVVEIIPEQYFRWTEEEQQEIYQLNSLFKIVPHGVNLSIATASPIEDEYLEQIKRVIKIFHSPYYGDHLTITRVPGIDIDHLSPVWYTKELLDIVSVKVNRIQEFLGIPFIFENMTHHIQLPKFDMNEVEFINQLVERTKCGLLLDITNVYTNSVNFHFNPIDFVKQLPLDYVVQIHVAGGEWVDGVLEDSQSQPVPHEIWRIFDYVAQHAKPKVCILERDRNFPRFSELLDEIDKARSYMIKSTLHKGRKSKI